MIALMMTVTAELGMPLGKVGAMAVKVMRAEETPAGTWLQSSTETKSLFSLWSVDISPLVSDRDSHVPFAVAVQLKGTGPPEPTSINTFWMGL